MLAPILSAEQPNGHHHEADDRCQPDQGANDRNAGGVDQHIDYPAHDPQDGTGGGDPAGLARYRERQGQRDIGRIGLEQIASVDSAVVPPRSC